MQTIEAAALAAAQRNHDRMEPEWLDTNPEPSVAMLDFVDDLIVAEAPMQAALRLNDEVLVGQMVLRLHRAHIDRLKMVDAGRNVPPSAQPLAVATETLARR